MGDGAKRAHVILAHPSPGSFNAAWFRKSCEVFEAQGYSVTTSDLYRLGFDPAERAEHYGDFGSGGFDVLKTQSEAQKSGSLPVDVNAEIEKLKQADLVIFHFPLWWFAPPAMLKGWLERVLVHGEFHTSQMRFEDGLAQGRQALFCVTCGVDENGGKPDGYEADTRMLLWPLAFSLFYCGFEVYKPEIVYGVHGFHEAEAKAALESSLADCLARHGDLLNGLADRPLMQFNKKSDFDSNGRLKLDAPQYSSFISHLKPA